MFPVSFEEENMIFDIPEGCSRDQVEPVSVLWVPPENDDEQLPVMISCWKLSKLELAEINKTGRIWLLIYGDSMPVVQLEVIKPFSVNEDA